MKKPRFTTKQLAALKIIAAGHFYPSLDHEEDGWHARWHVLGAEDNSWVDELVRESSMTRLSEDAEYQRHETLHDAWMTALKSRTGLVVWDDDECFKFAEELKVWSGSAEADVAARKTLIFRFEAEKDGFCLSCTLPHGIRQYRALGQAVYVFPLLTGLNREGGVLKMELTKTEAEIFLRSGVRSLREAGYVVEAEELVAEITADAEIFAGEVEKKEDAKLHLVVRVAGEIVTVDEVRFLLDQGSSLVYFRDRWIEVDRNILKEALRALERMENRTVSNPLSFAFGMARIGELEIASLKAHGWVRGLVNELKSRGESLIPKLELEGLNGELRDYQRRGVAWLKFMTDHGFGALLADDMGLGKTIQTIAWMLTTPKARPTLIVAPLTLLYNWQRELSRFAPTLRVFVHQGDRRSMALGFRRVTDGCDVVLTSYNLIVRDYSLFSSVLWSAMILDEAQIIKNPNTRVAGAVRALAPKCRIALTGTPIENSIDDIWSIEQFLNPGLLGDKCTFSERFSVKKLARVLEPFVLRRLKSDTRIANELGEKREIREYCVLSPEQRREYEVALVDFKVVEHSQGEIFALITSLKLICDGEGKLIRLIELLDTIFENGESALVFSQYAKVGEWLKQRLEERFKRKFPFLHGGLTVKERERQIREFNLPGARAFILSLKAGGFGLNLTKATHVIHFDRWWNPAVENQATDRAHRIGQDKTVFVHAFITVGTIEEHIDEILERKALVAGSVITAAEWLEAAQLD